MSAGAFLALNPVASAVAAPATSNLLNFSAIPVSTEDKVIVPKGYKATPLMSWGDPIFANAPEFDQSGKQDSKAQEKQFGDNTDGMSFSRSAKIAVCSRSTMNTPITSICLIIKVKR